MDCLPFELHEKIVTNLSGRDIINLKIALKQYEFVSENSRITIIYRSNSVDVATTFDSMTGYSTSGGCYAALVSKPYQAFMSYGYFIDNSKVLECFHRFGLKVRVSARTSTLNIHDQDRIFSGSTTVGHLGTQGSIVELINLDTHHIMRLGPEFFKSHDDISRWRTMGMRKSWYGGDGQSVCGHSGSPCPILCDDFVSSVPGYCYLQAFENRHEALAALKMYPQVHSLFNYIFNYDGNVCSFALLEGRDDVVHLSIEDGATESNLLATVYCIRCEKSTHMSCVYFPTTFPKCSTCMETTTAYILPCSRIIRRKVGALSLPDFMTVSDPVEMENYRTEAYCRHTLTADREESDIVIRKNGDIMKVFSIHSNSLRSMRHDYVASEWTSETDMPLTTIGVDYPEGKMTPDYIDVISRRVLELGTMNNNYSSSLIDSFNGKMMKYKDIIAKANAHLYVVIVGINRVITNLPMPQDKVQLLACRMLEIVNLELRISHLCGFNPFTDSLNENSKLVRLNLESIGDNYLVSDQYNVTEIKEFSLPPTESELSRAKTILQAELENAKEPSKSSKDDLNDYLSSFNSSNSKTDQKRICNFPMIFPNFDQDNVSSISNLDEIPDHLMKIWKESLLLKQAPSDPLYDKIRKASLNEDPSTKHLQKSNSLFKVINFSPAEEEELACIGIDGKAHDSESFRKKYEKNSKLSFSPETDTYDIDRFMKENKDEPMENIFISNSTLNMIDKSKLYSTGGTGQDSIPIWNRLTNTKIISFCQFMSYIFTELSYNYKQWTGKNEFIKRDLRYGVSMIIHNPKGHVFVTFSIPKKCVILETGRIGPKLYDAGTHYICDFSSYNEPTLEHFIKCGPYMTSIFIHLLSSYECDPMKQDTRVSRTMNGILLLYLNNKLDVEELVGSQRYLFMRVLEDVDPNPWIFVSRLPTVLRSRLTVYYLWKTIGIMEHYSSTKISKIPIYDNGMILYSHNNIKSLYHDAEISFHQKINEFYFGYVVSKERSRGGDRTFKVMTKLLENEYLFRDTKPKAFSVGPTTPKFSSNKDMLKFFLHSFTDIISSKLGQNFKQVLFDKYVERASQVTFGDLSTLKASARNHDNDLKIPDEYTDVTLLSLLKDGNKNEKDKRPKMIEAMTSLVQDYTDFKERPPIHIIELLPWCLNELIAKGYFDSDIFVKPQHMGDREIHVLESKARIVQFFVELFSKVICEFFPSETTCNPDTKDNFVKAHYTASKASLGNFNTHSKSADAAKWCHMHHTSHFAAMFEVIAPNELKNFLIGALSLWPKKRLNFPLELTSTMIKNMNNESGPLFKRFCSDFQSGTNMFTSKMGNKIEVQMGMFQGILHRTSSLYHTVINEVNKRLVESLISMRMSKQCKVSVVQGSDDSGMMISLKGSVSHDNMRLCKTLLGWKEKYSHHLSILPSEAKTSIGTHDMIEYNSEWHDRHKIVKPTFRWVSACLEVSVTERFIDRFRIFNQVLSQCLEGGASTLECAVIQLCQANMHYILMGFQNNDLSEYVADLMISNPDPLTGFMPLDFDVAAGVPGIEFQLFCLHKFSSYGATLTSRIALDTSLSYVPDEIPNYLKSKDLKSVKLKFTNMNLYTKFLNRLKLSSYEEALSQIEDNPLLLFSKQTSWESSIPSITLKVFTPGVKESISNMSPMLRMAASSSYLMNRRCLTVRNKDMRFNLPSLILENKANAQEKQQASDIFPLHHEFESVLNNLIALTRDSLIQDVILRKTSKSKVIVFEMTKSEFQMSAVCKRRWFGIGSIPLSNRQFDEYWLELSSTYKFLSPLKGNSGLRETCDNLGMSIVDCKYFIESLDVRTRSITLYDSASRSKSLSHSLSRIYWPHTKIIVANTVESDVSTLRSKLFSISSYWCSNERKEGIVHNWISDSIGLKGKINSISSKGQKLKIFRDYLDGSSKTELIRRIINLKSGCVGTFIQRQRGYGKSKVGKGQWLGQVAGVNVDIRLQDNICTLIRVNSLSDSVYLGKTLIMLLSDFGSDLSSDINSYSLTKSGSFKQGQGTKIEIDEQLEFSYADMLEQMSWDLVLKDFSLRLIVKDKQAGHVQYTLLSDSFNSRDWLEGNEIDIGDEILRKWSVGELCPSNLLSSSICKQIPVRRGSFMVWLKNKSTDQSSGWNMDVFRMALCSSYKIGIKEVNKVVDDSHDAYAIYEQIMSMDFDSTDTHKELLDWAEEVNGIEDKILFDSSEDDAEFMSDFIKMLNSVGNDEPYLDTNEGSRVMPHCARFFSNLNTLSVASDSCSFPTALERCRTDESYKIPGIVGKCASLILKEYHIANDLDDFEEIVDMDITASILSDSIQTKTDVENLDKNDIIMKLELINAMIEGSSSPIANKSLHKTKARYERIMTLLSDVVIDQKHHDYDDTMMQLCSAIISNKWDNYEQFPTMIELQPRILEALILNNPFSLSLTDYQRTRLSGDIYRKNMTPELMHTISSIYNNDTVHAIFLS